MNKLFIFFLLLLLFSCNSSSTTISVTNQSGSRIDSLFIEPNNEEPQKYISIENGASMDYVVNMAGIPKTDGSYSLVYKLGEIKKVQNFGYYSNGSPMEASTKITITADSLIINN